MTDDLARFAQIAGRPEASLDPALWTALDLDGIAPERVGASRAAWAARAYGEARTAAFHRALAGACRDAGLPVEILSALERTVRDEDRHAELCARISERVGPPDAEWSEVGQAFPEPGASITELARCAVSGLCLGEGCAVGLLRATLDGQADPGTRSALRLLLRDEAHHERIGWALAERLVPGLGDDDREWLAAALAHSLAFYETVHADRPIGPDEPISGHGGGVIGEAAFAAAFYRAVEGSILPRLASLGIPAWEAWALCEEARQLWPAALSAR